MARKSGKIFNELKQALEEVQKYRQGGRRGLRVTALPATPKEASPREIRRWSDAMRADNSSVGPIIPVSGRHLGMKLKIIFVVAALVCLLPQSASSQDEDRWKKYESRTLQSILDSEAEGLDASGANVYLSADSFPSRVKLAYLEKSRPLPDEKKRLLEEWARMWKGRVPADTAEVFQTEVLFGEGSQEHWIAVQKKLLSPLAKEAKAGQVMTTYLMLMGAIKVDGHWEWLFAINEFDAS
jgi:hypothetical protein